ncbi:CHAT domain-containing protein [Roseofilum capinflatum]|uniref:Tetratricopeptide repeat protein n=1 Tax=Roseofilum capinflatum BLCC-M114 TaxID=3022440 RepID=A0ABT7B2I4_9CYAN|nr:tetratricopeptide repeat protein [Roseofilum capinflatum]MDJ1172776.1 tetratricopeptide repeat protein [Roseofilum capinflatum BLCC-M114]
MRIVGTLVALGVWMTPVMVTVGEQPSWAQSQQRSREEVESEVPQLMLEAVKLRQQGKIQESTAIWQEVLAITQQFKLRELEALAFLGIGQHFGDIGEYIAALEAYQQALPIFEETNDLEMQVTTLLSIGKVYHNISQHQKAINHFHQAILISQNLEDRSREAMALNSLGTTYNSINDYAQAIDYLQQSLTIRREIKDKRGEAFTLHNLATIYYSTGQLQLALEFYQQMFPIVREIGEKKLRANVVSTLAVILADLGYWQHSIDHFNEALQFFQQVHDQNLEARTLNNLGTVYNRIGQTEDAIDKYQQALQIFRDIDSPNGEAVTLNNLGEVYSGLGDLEQSVDYHKKALNIFQRIDNMWGQSVTFQNLGSVYIDLGEEGKSIEYHEQALRIDRQTHNRRGEARTLHSFGVVYLKIGNFQQALYNFSLALPIMHAVGDEIGKAANFSNTATVYKKINQPEKAIKYYEQSLEIILRLRSNLKQDKQEYRKTFINIHQGSAIALTSLLIQQNRAKEAFTWINRVSTYELADYTRLLGAKVQNPEAQALIDQYNQRWQQLENLRRQLQRDPSDELSRRISTLETENIELGERIAQQFPEVADIFETTPTDIEQLQATIPEGTLVLQPVPLANVTNTPNTLALFLLTRDSFEVVQTSLDVEEFNQLLDQYPEQLEELSPFYKKTSSKLYDILIRPIEKQISAYNPENLSIIATGKLRYIPFESLYDKANEQFLIEKYPINYLTRLSKTPPNREPSAKTNAILAMGNPVPHNPHNLPGAEEEVKTITQLFPNSQAYLHDQATLDQFKQQAPRFGFLHLATHGCFQPNGCEKYDMAANTILFANNTQWPITDAALLGLDHTRLIALSACQTAREADTEGKSISGVAYLFERAGAQAVMATLWSVSDKHTQTLMSNFYQHVAAGMSQGEALREAKLAQINTGDEDHPFYWSAFILIGDPR